MKPTNRRGLAAAVSGSTEFSYTTSDAAGIKVASRDVAGPTTKLAVIAKAGTRYQSAPGLTSGLEQFAFKVCIDSEGFGWRQRAHCFILLLEHPKTISPADYERV